ncbi:MAG: hypothetical protein R3B96_08915 [Pirellulaceae bacterium]
MARFTTRHGRWIIGLVALLIGAAVPGTAANAQDLARLANPEVATRVGLDDTQRAALQQLIQSRVEEIAAAPEERNAITQRFQEAARALLTDEQWERFNGGPVTSPLKFNFREQNWPSVLEWFAEQSDSSLIMDAVPDGDFTYVDDRGYSPAEAIDLINSVLLTKGFTLIRREKMMTLVRLGDTIPLELIPRVRLEDLPSRGRFEMVAVEFSIGDRSMDAVLNEVTPYLGSFGRAVPLAQRQRLLVVESAGKMETINVLIASVPGPPPQRPPAPKPPDPTFATYSLGPLDPQATLETLKGLISSERLTVDEKTRVLSAFVVPDQHTAIQRYLEELIAKQSERGTPQLAVYKTTLATATAIRDQIESTIPGATARVDESTGQLLVSGDAVALQAVAALLEPLDLESVGGEAIDDERELKIHVVEPTQVTSLTTLLTELLPNATIIPDATSGQLAVRATAADQERIRGLVESLQALRVEREPTLRRVPAPPGLDATRLTQIAALVPTVTAELDTTSRSIILTGPPADQARLEKLLEQWRADAPAPEERELHTYPATEELRARFLAVQQALPEEFTGLQVLTDSLPNQLSIVATPSVHAKVAQWLERLQADIGPRTERVMRAYELTEAQRTLADAWIAEQFKSATIQPWDDPRTLLLSATAEEHDEFGQWLQTLTEQLPADQPEVLVAYSVEHADPATLAPLLQRLVGAEDFVVDTAGRQIVAVATLEQHAKIKAALVQIDRPEAANAEQVLESYDLGGLNGTTVVTMVTPMWPNMRLSVDATSGRLIAWGTPLEQQELSATLEKLADQGGDQGRSIQVLNLEAGELTTLPTILKQLAPGALLSLDPTSRTLSVWGTAEEQQRISEAVTQLGAMARERQELSLYPVARDRGTPLVTTLATLFPTARISLDAQSRQLVVLATPVEQTRIAEFLTEIKASDPTGDESVLKVYRLDTMTGVAFTTLVAQLVPTATVILSAPTGPAAVWANEVDHARIAEALRGIEGELEAGDDQTLLRPYRLPDEHAATFPTLLARVRPTATLISGSGTNQVVIADSAAGHDQLTKWVESLDQLAAETAAPELQSHRSAPISRIRSWPA